MWKIEEKKIIGCRILGGIYSQKKRALFTFKCISYEKENAVKFIYFLRVLTL